MVLQPCSFEKKVQKKFSVLFCWVPPPHDHKKLSNPFTSLKLAYISSFSVRLKSLVSRKKEKQKKYEEIYVSPKGKTKQEKSDDKQFSKLFILTNFPKYL